MNEPKTLWHTIEIKVPADMLVKTPSGRISLRKTLTKTFNISKSNKQPAIKLTPANVNHAEIINDGAQTTRARMRQIITRAPLPAPVKLKLKSMKNINKMIDEFQLYLKDLKPMELPVKVKKEVKALIKEVEAVKETIEDITDDEANYVPEELTEKEKMVKNKKNIEILKRNMKELLLEPATRERQYGHDYKWLPEISNDTALAVMKYAKEIQNLKNTKYPMYKISNGKLVVISEKNGKIDDDTRDVPIKDPIKDTIEPPKIKEKKNKHAKTEVKKIEKKMDKLLYHGSNNFLYKRISEDDATLVVKYAKEIQNITKEPYIGFRMTIGFADQLVSIDTQSGTPDGRIAIIIDYDD